MTTWSIIVISALGLWIGYLQYRLAKQRSDLDLQRSKLDLYDKRYPVFLATIKYLEFIASCRNINNEELDKFKRISMDNEFLFGEDVQQYLDILYKKGHDFQIYHLELDDHTLPMEKRERLVKKQDELLNWFREQFKESYEVFKKYLAIDKK